MKKQNSDSNSFLAQIAAENELLEQQNLALEAIENEYEDSKKEEIEEKRAKDILDYIAEDGGPTRDIVEQWKNSFGGKVYAVRYEAGESYIYRYLTRTEHKLLIKKMQESKNPDRQDIFQKDIVSKCLLYPAYTPNWEMSSPAGTIETLFSQIMFSSNFIPEQFAIEMITKL